MWPEDFDGFIFEQKIKSTISEEFCRIQAKVNNTLENVKGHNAKMVEFEEKVDLFRA
jgi:hypothetical protein